MAQIGARTPITTLQGYAVISPLPIGWKRLSEIATIPPECTGAILQALDGAVIWMQSPGAMPANPTGFTLPKTDYLTLEEFTQVSQLCIDTTASSKFSVQFYTGPIGALPQVTDPVAASSGGGGGGGGVQSVDGFFPLASTGGENPTIWVPDNGITLEQLQDLITSFNLTPGWDYQLQNATSQNLRIIVRALTVNTISKRVEMVDDSFDLVYYDINTNTLKCYDDIACIIESDGTNWRMFDNAAHAPKGVLSVYDVDGYSFAIAYTRSDYTHVINSSFTTDEQLAHDAWTLGASVGLQTMLCQVFMHKAWAQLRGPGFVINPAYAKAINSAAWNSTNKTLDITTPQTEAGPLTATSANAGYRCIAVQVSATMSAIQFVDSSGTVADLPDGKMNVYFQRISPLLLNAAQFYAYSNAGWKANVWIRNLMMKKIV